MVIRIRGPAPEHGHPVFRISKKIMQRILETRLHIATLYRHAFLLKSVAINYCTFKDENTGENIVQVCRRRDERPL